jgi:thiol:disulfide interchange protein
MKKMAFIFLVSLVCSSFSKAEEVRWYSWNEAHALSKTLDKPMMVFVYAKWCHLCQRMDTKVFTDKKVVALLNRKYIPVKLDAESPGALEKDGTTYTSMELLAELTDNQFRGIPAYLFIPEKTGEKCKLDAGLKDPKEMLALLISHK